MEEVLYIRVYHRRGPMIPKSKIEALLHEIEQGLDQLEVSLQNAVAGELTEQLQVFQGKGSSIETKMKNLEQTLFVHEDRSN